MERRKEELEKKRQKLAELRKAREERKKQPSGLVSAPSSRGSSLDSVHTTDKRDVDDLVASLVGTTIAANTAATVANTDAKTANTDATTLTATTPTAVNASRRPAARLDFAETVVMDLPPAERIIYSKEVQTSDPYAALADDGSVQILTTDELRIKEMEMERRIRDALVAETELQRNKELEERRLENERIDKLKQQQMIDEQQRAKIIHSADFVDFFDTASKIIEKALNEPCFFLNEYTGEQNIPDGNLNKDVQLEHIFADERWTKYRSVMDMQWSPKYSELFLAAYNKNPASTNDPDGVLLIWNVFLKDRPEFVFYAQSDITAATFSPFHPNIIAGGTYSGQVLLWDTRTKYAPVLKSSLSTSGHTYPVYSIAFLGTQNAHQILSSSTDGLVCTWQSDLLAQPVETLQLNKQSPSRIEEVPVTTLGFASNETSTFIVGTEDGNIYRANRYDGAGSKAGLCAEKYAAHYGAVTGLHFHPSSGPIDFSYLFLTSSIDWSVNLWKSKASQKTSLTSDQVIQPLQSFDGSNDYVYDVKWSPSHPAMFGTVNGKGILDLWNLNTDTEVPIVSVQVTESKALNKIGWEKDGKRCCLGSSDGRSYVYNHICTPTNDDCATFQRVVHAMELNSDKQPVGK